MKPLRDEKGRIKSLGYPVRYPQVKSQNFLDQKYRDRNINKLEYLVNGKWVSRNYVPERMKYNNEFSKKFMRSEQGFFQQMGYRNSKRHKSHSNQWSGKLELGKRDDLVKHCHEQQEKNGDKQEQRIDGLEQKVDNIAEMISQGMLSQQGNQQEQESQSGEIRHWQNDRVKLLLDTNKLALCVGEAGTGKTHMAEQLSKELNCKQFHL